MNQWLKTPNLGQTKQTKQNSGKVKSLHFSYNKGTIDYEISHYLLYSTRRTDMQETYHFSASRRCQIVEYSAEK